MSDVNIGINVQWDNQKQMEQARKDLLSLGKSALASSKDFGKTDAEIQKAFSALLPSINTASKAMKVFSNTGYEAWVKYQKQVEQGSKGVQKALSNQVKNYMAGFEKMAKSTDVSAEDLQRYRQVLVSTALELEKVAKENQKVATTFNAGNFLQMVEKNKKATMAWGSETVALSKAMETIAKKGSTLEFANTTGKHTESIARLREEYDKLGQELAQTSMGKFNSMLNEQYKYTESTKGSIEALKEKYKALDAQIRGLISSGDTANLEAYKTQLAAVGTNLNKLEQASAKFDKAGFFTNLDKNTAVLESMDGRLVAVNARMKSLRTAIIKVSEAGNANEKEIAEMTAEYRKLTLEQAKLEKQSKKTGVRVTNLLKSFVSAQAILWVVRSAFNKVVLGLRDAAQAAADAEETMNLFNVVFEEVNENANTMATVMSKSFGIAKSSIAEGLSTLGDFAEGLGMSSQAALEFSSSLSSRMLDVISFKNVSGDTTEILKNLASGLAGNTENFRTWGYVIKEASVKMWLAQHNMDKLTGTALELAKVQARAAIFMEQSSNAAGDMARTFDSTVNISRRLKEAQKQLNETIGSEFNKILTPIKSGLLEIVEGWNDANQAAKDYNKTVSNTPEPKAPTNIEKILKEAGVLMSQPGRMGEEAMQKQAKIAATSGGSYGGLLLVNEFSKSTEALKGSRIATDDLITMMERLGTDISANEIIATLRENGAIIDGSTEMYAQSVEQYKQMTNELNKAADSIKSFKESMATWGLVGEGGLGQSLATNMQAQITPLQSALGGDIDSTSLASAYMKTLEPIIESAYNTLITAQNDGNKDLERLATEIINKATAQYKEAQDYITLQELNAELDKKNAEAFATAVSNFQNAFASVESNIANMAINIFGLVSDTKVTASMLGQDSSLVAVEQQRASALTAAGITNQEARANFEKTYGIDTTKFDVAMEKGRTLPDKGFTEYVEMIEGQANNIKLTNQYYDRLLENTKLELAVAGVMEEANKKSLDAFNELYKASMVNLDAQVKSGEITEEDYNNQKAILDYQKDAAETAYDTAKKAIEASEATQKAANAMAYAQYLAEGYVLAMERRSNLEAAMYEMGSSISTTSSPSGIFSGAKSNYATSMGGLETSYQQALDLASTKQELLNLDALYETQKKAIEDAYESDKVKDFFSATGLDKAFGQEMFADFGAIFEDDFNLTSLGEAALYLLSKFESFQKVLDIVDDALAGIAPLIDSFLAPVLLLLQPLIHMLESAIIPILEILFPLLQGLSLILLPLIATVDTVIIWLEAFGTMLYHIITLQWGKLDDDAKKAADRTTDAWTEVANNMEEIANMTLETANSLSEADSAYLDAVNDMLKSGLLTGQEALQLASNQLGTEYTGGAYKYLDKESYNKQYDNSVNIGTVTINAKDKTMEEIFEELQEMYRKQNVTGGVA